MSYNYDLLPEHMQDGMRLYIERGVEPGSFITAVLCNDLMGALGKADDINRHRLFDYGLFLYNEVPSSCFGSREKVAAWVARGGLQGNTQKDEQPEE